MRGLRCDSRQGVTEFTRIGELLMPCHEYCGLGHSEMWANVQVLSLADAKPERGRAKVQEVCSPCHGERGVSASPKFPNLAGQSGTAIYNQLNDYHTGSRTNQFMTDIAKALDEANIAHVAAYYAGQPMRNPNPSTLASSPDPIVELVELGDRNRNIPPCAACHRQVAGRTGPLRAAPRVSHVPA
jgi:cytochrome c553